MLNKRQRRDTFDGVALLYDRVRPGYPEALFEDVVAQSRIPDGGHILEVGCGTGQATLPFARRGYPIFGIELGADLASVAQHKLEGFPNARITVGAFETTPVAEGAFDLLISATAFHWIDPNVRYSKAAQALKPDGAIALFWNAHVQTDLSADFFEAVQEVYWKFAPDMAKRFPGLLHPDRIRTPVAADIDRSELFGPVRIGKYKWDTMYDAASYVDVLRTYSDHILLDDTSRENLFEGIASLIDTRFGGQIAKEYLAVLYVAHRR